MKGECGIGSTSTSNSNSNVIVKLIKMSVCVCVRQVSKHTENEKDMFQYRSLFNKPCPFAIRNGIDPLKISICYRMKERCLSILSRNITNTFLLKRIQMQREKMRDTHIERYRKRAREIEQKRERKSEVQKAEKSKSERGDGKKKTKKR